MQKLDAEQLEELKEAFNLFDTDGNGEGERGPSEGGSSAGGCAALVIIHCTPGRDWRPGGCAPSPALLAAASIMCIGVKILLASFTQLPPSPSRCH